MSTTQDRGAPGLKYPTDIPASIPVPVHKAVRMIVDNLYFLRGQIDTLSGMLGTSTQTTQQIINETIKLSGGGGGGGGGGSTGAIIYASTHAIRIITYGAAADPVGTLFIETDRSAIYYISDSTGTKRWVFAAGAMVGAISGRPADLGANDIGFTFTASDTTELTEYLWTGSSWITIGGLREIITDAVTAASSNVSRNAHRSTGIPAAGFGANARVELDNDTNALADASSAITSWTSATTGTETSTWMLQLRNAGAALADFFQVLISGIRFKVGGFAGWGKFTHANTADRLYTLSDSDGNLVYENSALTDHAIVLGNAGAKVKPGPLGTTVTVLHGNAGGDPTYAAVDLTADVTGVLPATNGGTGVSYNRIADTVALTNQSAAIISTNFANSGTVGTYRVSYYLEDTSLDLTAGTIQLQVTFTDAAGAVTVSSAALALTALGRTSGVFFIQLQSGSIAYSTALVGIIGTARYALYICLERLS